MRLVAVTLMSLTLGLSCAGDPPPPVGAEPPSGAVPEPGVLRLAGSGAMIPLARLLAAAWRPPAGSPRVVVEESLGSAGGVLAAHEGAVDLGMVSRPLTPRELALGLTWVHVATDAVVVAANPGAPVRALSSAQLRDLYAGAARTFPDGTPAAVLLRDRRESANAVLEQGIPGLTATPAPGRPWRVLYHDGAMLEALAATPNAIGVTSLGLLVTSGSRLVTLELDGHRPGPPSLLDGSWPLVRPLAFVARPERVAKLRPFLSFVASPEAAALIAESGYRPVEPSR